MKECRPTQQIICHQDNISEDQFEFDVDDYVCLYTYDHIWIEVYVINFSVNDNYLYRWDDHCCFPLDYNIFVYI